MAYETVNAQKLYEAVYGREAAIKINKKTLETLYNSISKDGIDSPVRDSIRNAIKTLISYEEDINKYLAKCKPIVGYLKDYKDIEKKKLNAKNKIKTINAKILVSTSDVEKALLIKDKVKQETKINGYNSQMKSLQNKINSCIN